MFTLGLPAYANVAPLAHFLRPEGFAVKTAVPTELNRSLLAGEMGLSLVSSAFFLEHKDRLSLLPGFGVAVLGKVHSVNLFANKPLQEVRRVALTTESATSVRLLRLLLGEREYRREAGGLELLGPYDAVLLIGDRAIRAYFEAKEKGVFVLDLAEAWYQKTRLPFVFAVFAYPKASPPPAGVVEELKRARKEGIARLGEVARREADRLLVPEEFLLEYLWNFRYHLDEPDRDGLIAFSRALGLGDELF